MRTRHINNDAMVSLIDGQDKELTKVGGRVGRKAQKAVNAKDSAKDESDIDWYESLLLELVSSMKHEGMIESESNKTKSTEATPEQIEKAKKERSLRWSGDVSNTDKDLEMDRRFENGYETIEGFGKK